MTSYRYPARGVQFRKAAVALKVTAIFFVLSRPDHGLLGPGMEEPDAAHRQAPRGMRQGHSRLESIRRSAERNRGAGGAARLPPRAHGPRAAAPRRRAF